METADAAAFLESGRVQYIVYTGAVKDGTLGDYNSLHRRAMQLGIPCLTSTDTANALCGIIESRFTEENTELVDVAHMRSHREAVRFTKMQSCGNDYIFIENFDGRITCPESLCVSLCAPHTGVGGDGIVLIEKSGVADAKMRSFNKDGSEGRMAGNNIRCVAKLLYDEGIVKKETMTVEAANGVHTLNAHLRDGLVGSVTADMGRADFDAKALPAAVDATEMIDYPLTVGNTTYAVTCLGVGNPHCVVFCESIDGLDLEKIGPSFEHHPLFPERINTEFVRVVNRTTLRMRVWERGNGETMACGTGACAAAAAAIRKGCCDEGVPITVKVLGGDLTVTVRDGRIFLTGATVKVYDGTFAY